MTVISVERKANNMIIQNITIISRMQFVTDTLVWVEGTCLHNVNAVELSNDDVQNLLTSSIVQVLTMRSSVCR